MSSVLMLWIMESHDADSLLSRHGYSPEISTDQLEHAIRVAHTDPRDLIEDGVPEYLLRLKLYSIRLRRMLSSGKSLMDEGVRPGDVLITAVLSDGASMADAEQALRTVSAARRYPEVLPLDVAEAGERLSFAEIGERMRQKKRDENPGRVVIHGDNYGIAGFNVEKSRVEVNNSSAQTELKEHLNRLHTEVANLISLLPDGDREPASEALKELASAALEPGTNKITLRNRAASLASFAASAASAGAPVIDLIEKIKHLLGA